jgi:UDP-GlcNAc:undecaprenyl-phosphate GlcNAc-1-phosphate transferase
VLLDLYSGAAVLAVFVVAFLATYVTVPLFASWLRHRGIVGIDAHKLDKPKIPEMCGISVILGLCVAGLVAAGLFVGHFREVAAFLGTILIAGTIGAIDDLRPLSSKLKPVLTAFAAIPILLLGTYNSHPVLPLIGTARLTILYPFLIPIAIAVTANAVNMLDVFNGSMSGTLTVVSLALAIVLALSRNLIATSFALTLAGSLCAFYLFNRCPARVFPGDTGTLAVGAALGALAVIGRIEVVTIVAVAPYIMNAFYGLASIGRLYERREVRSRPVRLRNDGKLEATPSKNAPVTFARLILAKGPMSEQQIVRSMIMLTALSSALAIVTFFLPQVP